MKIRLLLIQLILLCVFYFSYERHIQRKKFYSYFERKNKNYSTKKNIDNLLEEIEVHFKVIPIKVLTITNSKLTNLAYFFNKMNPKILDEIEVLELNRNDLANHYSLANLIKNLNKMPKLKILNLEHFGYNQYIHDLKNIITLKNPEDEIIKIDHTINQLINELLHHPNITELKIENYVHYRNKIYKKKLIHIDFEIKGLVNVFKDLSDDYAYCIYLTNTNVCDPIEVLDFSKINLLCFNLKRNKCCSNTENIHQFLIDKMIKSHFYFKTRLSIGKCFGVKDEETIKKDFVIDFIPAGYDDILMNDEEFTTLEKEKIKKRKEEWKNFNA